MHTYRQRIVRAKGIVSLKSNFTAFRQAYIYISARTHMHSHLYSTIVHIQNVPQLRCLCAASHCGTFTKNGSQFNYFTVLRFYMDIAELK